MRMICAPLAAAASTSAVTALMFGSTGPGRASCNAATVMVRVMGPDIGQGAYLASAKAHTPSRHPGRPPPKKALSYMPRLCLPSPRFFQHVDKGGRCRRGEAGRSRTRKTGGIKRLNFPDLWKDCVSPAPTGSHVRPGTAEADADRCHNQAGFC